MRVAVTSQNFRTVTGHAGKSRRFLIYEAGPDGRAIEVERLDLPKDMSFHEFHREGEHPVDTANVLITASCGEGFRKRMAERGIVVVVTGASEPQKAAEAVLKGEPLPAPEPDPAHVSRSAQGKGGHQHHHGHHHHD